MKYVLALAALFALVGFVGISHAKDAAKPKTHKGHLVKVEEKVLTYKGGAKGKGAEHTVKIDDSTVVPEGPTSKKAKE